MTGVESFPSVVNVNDDGTPARTGCDSCPGITVKVLLENPALSPFPLW
jgi:hypothetical protein